jgi:hypothetical protein
MWETAARPRELTVFIAVSHSRRSGRRRGSARRRTGWAFHRSVTGSKNRLSVTKKGRWLPPYLTEENRPKPVSQGPVIIEEFCNANDISSTSSVTGRELSWVKVNDVTWKLTDGTKIRVPGGAIMRHGRDDERAVAWVIDVGWPGGWSQWLARYGDVSYGPTTLSQARRAAKLMVAGGFEEPVQRVGGAAGRLNELAVASLSVR